MTRRTPTTSAEHDQQILETKLLNDSEEHLTNEIDESEVIAAPPPVPSDVQRRQLQIARVKRGIYFFVHSLAILLGIQIALELFNANPDNVFVIFIQVITAPFIAPFYNLFGVGDETGALLSAGSLLFAIVVYYLFAWIIAGIATAVMSRPIKVAQEDTSRKSHRQEPRIHS